MSHWPGSELVISTRLEFTAVAGFPREKAENIGKRTLLALSRWDSPQPLPQSLVASCSRRLCKA